MLGIGEGVCVNSKLQSNLQYFFKNILRIARYLCLLSSLFRRFDDGQIDPLDDLQWLGSQVGRVEVQQFTVI